MRHYLPTRQNIYFETILLAYTVAYSCLMIYWLSVLSFFTSLYFLIILAIPQLLIPGYLIMKTYPDKMDFHLKLRYLILVYTCVTMAFILATVDSLTSWNTDEIVGYYEIMLRSAFSFSLSAACNVAF